MIDETKKVAVHFCTKTQIRKFRETPFVKIKLPIQRSVYLFGFIEMSDCSYSERSVGVI